MEPKETPLILQTFNIYFSDTEENPGDWVASSIEKEPTFSVESPQGCDSCNTNVLCAGVSDTDISTDELGAQNGMHLLKTDDIASNDSKPEMCAHPADTMDFVLPENRPQLCGDGKRESDDTDTKIAILRHYECVKQDSEIPLSLESLKVDGSLAPENRDRMGPAIKGESSVNDDVSGLHGHYKQEIGIRLSIDELGPLPSKSCVNHPQIHANGNLLKTGSDTLLSIVNPKLEYGVNEVNVQAAEFNNKWGKFDPQSIVSNNAGRGDDLDIPLGDNVGTDIDVFETVPEAEPKYSQIRDRRLISDSRRGRFREREFQTGSSADTPLQSSEDQTTDYRYYQSARSQSSESQTRDYQNVACQGGQDEAVDGSLNDTGLCTQDSEAQCTSEQSSKILKKGRTKGTRLNTTAKEKRRYSCEICDKEFRAPSMVKKHKVVHTGEKPFKCHVCGKSYSTACNLKTHSLQHSYTPSLSRSGQDVSDVDEKNFPCTICNKRFATPRLLKSHSKTHTGEKPYTCRICNQAFAHLSTLRRHEILHTGEQPYLCDICNRRFSQISHLRTHILLHTGEKPHQCDICGKAFSRGTHLKGHILTHKRSSQN